MKSQPISLLGIFGAVLLASPALPVHAANLNTPGLSCQQAVFQGIPSSIQNRIAYTEPGVTNVADVPTAIVCNVPRSPVSTGTTVGFYVDGDNPTGGSTFCSMSSYSFGGSFIGSRGFTTSVPKYDEFVSFPLSLVGLYDYVTIMCVLPPNGMFRGVTSVQP